jgi:hypothetical protein
VESKWKNYHITTFPGQSLSKTGLIVSLEEAMDLSRDRQIEEGLKTKFRNKLQLSNSLRLKITRTDVDVNAVINSNRKQAHQSHTPHYEK